MSDTGKLAYCGTWRFERSVNYDEFVNEMYIGVDGSCPKKMTTPSAWLRVSKEENSDTFTIVSEHSTRTFTLGEAQYDDIHWVPTDRTVRWENGKMIGSGKWTTVAVIENGGKIWHSNYTTASGISTDVYYTLEE
ncbi:fatty acid-binding protein, heart-like [Antedon mediterranea]|uniref:fatty acid-binding protein, heart-like n=1 Tax=Antedon mediterranea TaxID=105859 RepID=UPI003AF632FD